MYHIICSLIATSSYNYKAAFQVIGYEIFETWCIGFHIILANGLANILVLIAKMLATYIPTGFRLQKFQH